MKIRIRNLVFVLIIWQMFATNTVVAQDKQVKDSTSILKESYEIMQKYLPEIKKVVSEHVAPVSKEVIKNDRIMTSIFRGVYEFLPAPIRWVIPKDTFVEYCLNNRDLLVEIADSNTKPNTNIKIDSTKHKKQ